MRFALAAAALLLLTAPAIAADLELPVKGMITSRVGWRLDPFGTGKLLFHRGIDIAVPVGTPVHATRKGRVVLAGDDHRGHGATVILEHDNGDRTLYGHNSAILVRQGEVVEAGTVVALSGSSGRSTGPHVHYEQQPGGRPYRPEKPEPADVEVAQSTGQQHGLTPAERRQLEQKMDESLKSILQSIGTSQATGQGG